MAEARWAPVQAAQLPPGERELWRALDGSTALAQAELAGPGPGALWRLVTLQRWAPRSQYDALHAALGAGLTLPGPTACVALGGQGFHGQHGRPWAAEPGNLFLTVALAPRAPARRLLPGFVMLPVVAVADAIEGLRGAGIAPRIKWVNDVLLDGRKVAGSLVATHVRGDVVETAVLGIGVNVARAPVLEPGPFVAGAGCLRDAGIATDAGAFLPRVLHALAHRYRQLLAAGPAPLLEAYRARSIVLGRRVELYESGHGPSVTGGRSPVLSGVVRAIEPDLSLRLEGHAEPVTRGRLRLEPGPPVAAESHGP